MTLHLTQAKDCKCPCHKGAAVVIHVVACCTGYVAVNPPQKPEQKS